METTLGSTLRIEEIPLFSGLSKDLWRELKRRVTILRFAASDCILQEGEHNPGRLYVVLDVVCNKQHTLLGDIFRSRPVYGSRTVPALIIRNPYGTQKLPLLPIAWRKSLI